MLKMYIRIANPPLDLIEKYHESQREFYSLHTKWIIEILRSNPVQWFLENRIMREQSIPKDNIKDIRIMRFPPKELPFKNEKQRILSGRYDPKNCQISIYPYPLCIKPEEPLPKDLLFPKPKLLMERLIKSLLEETLHAKYRLKYLKALEKPLTPKVKEQMNKIHTRIKKQADRYFREFKGWFLLKDSLFAEELKRFIEIERGYQAR